MEGRGAPMILSAVLTFFQSEALQPPHHTVRQLLRTLSMVLLEKVGRMGGGRKSKRFWALWTSEVVFPVQVRVSVMNVVLLTTSTAELLMSSGAWLGRFFLKSTMISLVFSTFRIRLLSLHHQLLHLLSVVQVVVVSDEAHHRGVVCKLHHVIGGEPGDAVVCHQGEQQGAQDAALRGGA